jgi:hypothetical protein
MQQMNFYWRSYCLFNMFGGTIMPIIRSSRELYKWLLPVVFCAWFLSCRYSVELRVMCAVCGLQQQNIYVADRRFCNESFLECWQSVSK